MFGNHTMHGFHVFVYAVVCVVSMSVCVVSVCRLFLCYIHVCVYSVIEFSMLINVSDLCVSMLNITFAIVIPCRQEYFCPWVWPLCVLHCVMMDGVRQ